MGKNIKDYERIIADEHHLRLLINNTDDPIWMVDTDLNIIECNSAFKKWVFWFIGQELDKGDHVLYNGKDKMYQEKYEMCYQLALQGRTFRSVEDMHINNETRYTTVSFNPVHDDDGKIVGVSCFARDITEQRKHLHKIEQQNTTLREIAFIESHKVRGPLANILGLQELYNYENPGDPSNKEIMEGISKMAYKLDLIIREVVNRSYDVGI